MTKFLTLMNPRSRRYRHRRSSRRVRRNPSRRKLYGAALAAHQRKVGGGSAPAKRRSVARRSRPVARRRNAPPRMTPAMRAKVSAGVRRYFAAKKRGGGSVSIARRSSPARRFSVSRGGFTAGSLTGALKGALTKPMLTKAGGAVLASFGTGYIMNRFSASLPLATNQYGRIAYMIAIPTVGAYLVRKKNRDLAEGMVIGGLVLAVNALIQQFRPGTVAPVAAYSRAPGNMGVAGELGAYSWYPGRTTNLGVNLANQSPFSASAW